MKKFLLVCALGLFCAGNVAAQEDESRSFGLFVAKQFASDVSNAFELDIGDIEEFNVGLITRHGHHLYSLDVRFNLHEHPLLEAVESAFENVTVGVGLRTFGDFDILAYLNYTNDHCIDTDQRVRSSNCNVNNGEGDNGEEYSDIGLGAGVWWESFGARAIMYRLADTTGGVHGNYLEIEGSYRLGFDFSF